MNKTVSAQQPLIYFGEVISSGTANTYELINTEDESNINTLFTVDVLVKESRNTRILSAIPADNNIKRIPVIGETVIVFQLYDHTSSVVNRRFQWYYLNPIGIKSSINNNIQPVNSETFTPDSKFAQTNVSLLQPYRGDLLIEGRYGNSIRFSNTIETNDTEYNSKPTWVGSESNTVNNSNPIIIISNGRSAEKTKSFTVENIQTDNSSLYLTSTQKIPDLLLGNATSKNSLNCYLPSESQFTKSQFIGTADRVILKAKSDIAVIDSPTAIILNTTGEVKIGNDGADEQMVHGNVLLELMYDLVQQLRTPIQCGSAVGTFVSQTSLTSIENKLNKLLSNKYYIKKT